VQSVIPHSAEFNLDNTS